MRLKRGLELIIFLYAFILYAAGPSVTLQAQEIICAEQRPANNTDPKFCNSDTITSAVSDWNLKYSIIYALPALFTVTFLGALSDSYGRKVAMLVSLLGNFVQYGSNLLLALFGWPLNVLFYTQGFYGLCGTYAAMFMAVFAACSDETLPEDRTARVGVLEGCLLVGLSAGSILAGLIVDRLGYVVLFSIIEALIVLLILVVLLLDETLPLEKRPKLTFKRANFVNVMKILFQNGRTFSAALVFMLCTGIAIGLSQVLILFARHVFNISAELNGYFQAMNQVLRAAGLFLILPRCLKQYNSSMTSQLIFAMLSSFAAALQFVLWAFLTQELWVFFVISGVGLVALWGTIVTRGLLSQFVSQDSQGALMGSIGVLEACAMPFLGVMLLNTTYSATVSSFPGAFLIVAAGVNILVGLILALMAWYGVDGPTPGYQPERAALLAKDSIND
eukprot:m.26533 g.26533  ORF g.26533 m.26533 type:complete len:447 (+) comp8944_c0_seq1:64-1404(+)